MARQRSDTVAVATITWARSRAEETRLCEALARLSAIGFPVAIADRGSSRRFSSFLAQHPGFQRVTPVEQGLVHQVKAAFGVAAALRTRWILYTESDKAEFFAQGLTDFVEAARQCRKAGVVIAARSARSLGTYPSMQQMTEGAFNELCRRTMGIPGDYCYGPFLMQRALLPTVAELPTTLGWGWRPFVFRAAHRSGLPLMQVVGDYPCPSDQRTEDESERIHRMRQLSQNIAGLTG